MAFTNYTSRPHTFRVGCWGFDTLLDACRFARAVARQYDIPATVYKGTTGTTDDTEVCTYRGFRRADRPTAPTTSHTGGPHAFN